MAPASDELVFAPLGGVGEIGMNLAIYGFGEEHRRQWIAVRRQLQRAESQHRHGRPVVAGQAVVA